MMAIQLLYHFERSSHGEFGEDLEHQNIKLNRNILRGSLAIRHEILLQSLFIINFRISNSSIIFIDCLSYSHSISIVEIIQVDFIILSIDISLIVHNHDFITKILQ